jgi:triacylglycerol lipase
MAPSSGNLPRASAIAAHADPEPSDKGPLLLVHGHNGNEHDWDYWKPILEKEGWQPKAISLVTDDWDAQELADQVAMHVQALCRTTGRPKIDVLAHSMGGLATRYYIKFKGGDQHIRRLVTLSTPNHGIGYALPGRWITVAKLLSPHSAFLNSLNEPDETYGDVLYTCVWSTKDYTQTLPWASGRLKGAWNYVINGTTHSGMLSDPRLLPAIEEGLTRKAGTPVGPEQKID